MKIKAYKSFKKAYKALPAAVRHKVDRQIEILTENYLYPSLHTKKIKGMADVWEARVDIHYRMTFEIIDDTVYLRTVGNHDEVLGRP